MRFYEEFLLRHYASVDFARGFSLMIKIKVNLKKIKNLPHSASTFLVFALNFRENLSNCDSKDLWRQLFVKKLQGLLFRV